MTAQPKTNTLRKGFTLIELLVVLGILGILATALVATIDPFEQLKKANDANVKNAAVELANSSLRYYTTHNGMPWHTVPNGGVTGCGTAGVITGAQNANTDPTKICVQGLIDDGELKTQFLSATTITNKLYLNGTAGQAVSVCYQPDSKSQQRDVNTNYNALGVKQTDGVCQATGNTDTTVKCYWCATL